jgi:hypothetical protein
VAAPGLAALGEPVDAPVGTGVRVSTGGVFLSSRLVVVPQPTIKAAAAIEAISGIQVRRDVMLSP